MKKTPATIIALTIIINSYGQNIGKHELKIGYGYYSLIQLVEGVQGGEDGFDSRPVKSCSGAISVSYRFRPVRWFSFGAGVAYERENGNMNAFVNSSGNGAITEQSGTFKRQAATVVIEAMFHYPPKYGDVVSAYSYFGVGGAYLNELDAYSPDYYDKHYYNGVNSLGSSRQVTKNRTEPSVQICPIGVTFGKKIGGYIELGFGYKGILNGGVLIKL